MKKISDYISEFQVTFDRGSIYWRYINPIATPIIIALFISKISIWHKILTAVISFLVIIIMGYIDRKSGVMKKSQKIYGDENPTYVSMHRKLDEIINKLKK